MKSTVSSTARKTEGVMAAGLPRSSHRRASNALVICAKRRHPANPAVAAVKWILRPRFCRLRLRSFSVLAVTKAWQRLRIAAQVAGALSIRLRWAFASALAASKVARIAGDPGGGLIRCRVQHIHSAKLGHHEVEHDHVRLVAAKPADGGQAVRCRVNFHPLLRQSLLVKAQDHGVVVHKQHPLH